MNTQHELVCLRSLGDKLAGAFFLPATEQPVPVMIICHGAGEYKENYFELCEFLASRDIATLALDMHGHGQSGGEKHFVNMREWVADVRAAVDFLQTHPRIDGNSVAAFGLSSGGTAILEAAVIDPRLKSLVALDATVRNSQALPVTLLLKSLVILGKIKRAVVRRDLCVPLAKMGKFHLASDPEVNARLHADPRSRAAFMAFPFPSSAEAFFVDTIRRVARITAPTLVLWGGEDKVDPPESGRRLYAALTCEKQLHIIPGNGHMGHLDRNKAKVFALTAEWILQTLSGMPQRQTDAAAGLHYAIQNHRGGSGQESWTEREVGAAFAVP